MISTQNRVTIIELITEAVEAGARISPCCNIVGITIRTYERWIFGGNINIDQRPLVKRPEPKNKLSKDEYESVLKVSNLPQYADLPPSQIVPSIADRGIYIASESTFYRILRHENMQNHRGRSKSPGKAKEPETHIAYEPNKVWTWDITYLNTSIRGRYYKLYMIVDIFSRKIVGWEVWEDETGEHASELVEKAVIAENARNNLLVLHSDNGTPMKASTLKSKLELLGVMASYSRPRVSNDNPYSESLFRTCKYRSNYPSEGFSDIEEARKWVMEFVEWYNNIHYHSGMNFTTPNSRHTGVAGEIMENRKKVYTAAKALHPERWSKGIRNFYLPEFAALNPIDEEKTKLKSIG
ncbi:IS3 family transposase [Pseudobacteroides cellulosolvens]|uniref:Integrase catalytic region n=1 Tax=Pseudobacteroides cellulosolvens ATCC 35603 = DSM 2933 TaxID=398512 RepID=A0A0L6JQX1_9FIRM|nr:IS3 family transposase [Pseudobacteroides cellulosolvens]KNY28188.1 Integrase catalytic region [Pseudobacteroides cellulosolvens ATCC 35603 = DSM 2933]